MAPAAEHEVAGSISERMDAELRAQGGAIASLMELATVIRRAALEVAHAVEGVAQDIDRERRGAFAVTARTDEAMLFENVERLLAGALTPHGRPLVERLAAMVRVLEANVPANERDPGRANRWYEDTGSEAGRRIARALGAKVPEPPASAAPAAPVTPPKQPRPARKGRR